MIEASLKQNDKVRNLYEQGKVRFNYLLDRTIDLCNMVLMDVYYFPWPAVQNLAKCIARYVGDISWLLRTFPRLSAYKLTGEAWTIIFVGGEENLREVHHLFFEEEVSLQELGRIALWNLSAQTQQWLAEGVDLVICELSRIHPNRPQASITFTIPTWVQQVLDIPEPPELLISGNKSYKRSLRRAINNAQKAGFTYRFSQAKADLDYFYYHMYLPFVKSRHGDLALVTPYQDQKQRWFSRGGLILVTQGNKPIAGSLCYLANNTCFATDGGILEPNSHLFRQGLNAFLIWCMITWGHEHGAKIFDPGGSHAWRSNGAFTFKRAWGTKVIRRKRIYGVWTFLAQSLSPALQDYINRLGFISEIDKKFYSVFINDSASVIEADIKQELLAIENQGLDGLVIVTAHAKPATITR